MVTTTNNWSSSIVAEELIEELDYETGLLKTPLVTTSSNANSNMSMSNTHGTLHR